MHLKENAVMVTPGCVVIYVASPGSEMAFWINRGATWTRERVQTAITDALWDLDQRRRELESALAAVTAIPDEYGSPFTRRSAT